jgi:hypothetical protein
MGKPEEVSFLKQLMYLKGMTVRTGSIHEAQALQIRNWPLTIPGVKSAEAHVNTDAKIVKYVLIPKSKAFKTTVKVTEMCTLIDKFIKSILWDETTVIMEVNKRAIYDSRNR